MKNENMKLDRRNENITNEKSNFTRIIQGILIAIIITLICLTIYSALLTYTNISENTITPVVLVISGISILIGSSIATRKLKKQGMVNGGIIGLIYILFIYLLSSILSAEFGLNTSSIIMIIVCIITGMIGGIVGINVF